MAAPNIVNVASITGITTFIAGINTGGTGGPIPINTAGVPLFFPMHREVERY